MSRLSINTYKMNKMNNLKNKKFAGVKLKSHLLYLVIFLLIYMLTYCKTNQSESLKLIDSYLDQSSPGMVPEIFAPGFLSTEANESNATFTPEGDAVYFTGNGEHGQDIMVIEKKNGKWQDRKPASFSNFYRDVDPFITPDGNKLFFSSNRSIDGNDR